MATLVFTPSQGVYISEYYGERNFYGSDLLYCGQFNGNTDRYRSLLKFDISALPVSSTIQKAKLKLFIFRNDAPAVSREIKVFQALSPFSEYNVTYTTQPLIPSNPAASLSVTSEINTYLEFDVTALVNSWYIGEVSNNGIVLVGLETVGALVGFGNVLYSNSLNWPSLEVEYEKGIFTKYPVENLTTADNWIGSAAIPLGSRLVSFGVINTGTANGSGKLQTSPDGSIWIDTLDLINTAITFYFAPGETLAYSTSGFTGAYARIAVKSYTDGNPTTMAVYPMAVEA